MRRVLVDLYCGAGGCTKGYQEAGFYVVGVDNVRQPHYCGDEFVQMDAIEFLRTQGVHRDIDAIHASPPCQHYSIMKNIQKHRIYPDLIGPTRDAISVTGLPYIIENVEGARDELYGPVRLCGTMFDLRVFRHRLFECNFPVPQPSHLSHTHFGKATKQGRPIAEDRPYVTVGGHFSNADYGRQAMGIPWMNRDELAQAIPPAYTRYIGQHLQRFLDREQRFSINSFMRRAFVQFGK